VGTRLAVHADTLTLLGAHAHRGAATSRASRVNYCYL
jgi:hypothetical protein